MKYSKFSDYYADSLVKDPSKDYLFEKDNSEHWVSDHSALTSKGSLILGFTENSNPQYFSDFYIIPDIIENIKKYKDRNIVFLTNETDRENYVYERICNKFPDKDFAFKKITENIFKDIRMLELENKNVIAILESEKIFSYKNLIEYI